MNNLKLCILTTISIITLFCSLFGQTPCENGYASIYPCNKIDLLSNVSMGQMGGVNNCNDIWGWTDPNTGVEYALVGMANATSFIDLSDPVNPIYIGILPTHNSNSLWRDIKVNNDHAYIVSEASNHGMQVFDLSRLDTVQNPPVTFTEDGYFNGHGKAHNVVINEDSDFAYSVGCSPCSGGLVVTDISNPTVPVLVGCYDLDGYIHDAQCVTYQGPDPDHQGSEICFNCHSGSDKLTIVDVTDKGDMENIATITYPNARTGHQGWLTEDHKYFLMGDEGDEIQVGVNTTTYIFDVRDLDAPVLIGTYVAAVQSTDHNLYTHNGLVYEANYSSGLRILDTTGVSSGTLSQIAYFDEYWNHTNSGYDGAWSSYPYFESGIVIINDFDYGLYVVMPRLSLGIKAFLEGPFDLVAGVMHDSLRVHGLIPLTEPYTGLGFTQVGGGGGETIDPGILTTTGTDAIVDWVMVELRGKEDSSTVVATRCGLIQRDGDIVDTDGYSMLQFGHPVREYFVSVRHRNHLGVMTSEAHKVSIASSTIDLTNGTISIYGTQPVKDISNTDVLWAGNVVIDDKIKYTGLDNDRDPILVRIGGVIPTAAMPGYFQEDVNMSGVTKYTGANNDRDPILINIGGVIPTSSRIEQLPN